ncbi:E3 ubiquitin-protein ligase RNF25 isoform X1 [Rhodnius prolixus]|uniref:Putative e3 ubiquitin-protein ligase rnf25 panstrongylus lignarius n=1 Tax=Rhodnius prolixus TaxID=13249 RepID=A0A4P6D8S5_RHOPR
MHDDERVAEELEALQAILMDEIKILTDESGKAVGIETEVHPWTALDTEQQFVRVSLEVQLPCGYPDIRPTVRLFNPRGLDDSTFCRIREDISKKCTQNLGQPVIFEIIEIVKEQLTASNMPCVACCICLYGFRSGDHFTKTQCYHYFHSHCLAGHLTASENIFKEEQDKLPPWQQTATFQAVCPVCRAGISYDVEQLRTADPPQELVEAPKTFRPTPELRQLQEKMEALYLKQRSKGGIIQQGNRTPLLLSKLSHEDILKHW